MSTNGIRTLRNTGPVLTDRRLWKTTSVASRRLRSGTPIGADRHDDYMGNARREVAAIALRIAGSFAIVLTFTAGLAYLVIRAVTP